jgi:hypothetical protein
VQHTSHVDELANSGVEILTSNRPDVPRNNQVMFQLRGGSQSIAKESRELSFALLFSALDDFAPMDIAARTTWLRRLDKAGPRIDPANRWILSVSACDFLQTRSFLKSLIAYDAAC